MSDRIGRAWAVLCALVGLSAITVAHAAPDPLAHVAVRIVPTDAPKKRPFFVFLHGLCEEAAQVCPRYGKAIGGRGVLVCPRGNVACAGGGATWRGPERENNVVYGVEAAMLAEGSRIDATRGTLIGWSLGASVALDLATREPGWWKGLVLVSSMTIEPDASALRAAGVRRVVLAAGELDASRAHMEAVAKRLKAEGFDARWISLGKVGHVYPQDLAERMGPALAWASGEEAP